MHEGQKAVKKVFFIIPTLAGGGAERVMLQLLRHSDRNRFRPILVVFEKKGPLLSELPADIDLRVLRDREIRYGMQWLIVFSLAKMLRSERPHIVISFMWYTNFVTLLAKLFSRIKSRVVISERYSLSPSLEGDSVEMIRRFVVRLLYRFADSVIVNSKEMGNQLHEMTGIPKARIPVIYNPIDIERVRRSSREKVDHPWFQEKIPIIVGIGRMTRQKGFDYLCRSMRILAERSLACRLVLLGTGPEENNLKKLVSDLGLGDQIHILGFQQNPYKYLSHSTLFVLSSLYEGFPNVLLEAMALGVPSIATRCPTGPEELVTDGMDGILVPPADEQELASAIEHLLSDNALRARLSDAAQKRSREFAVNHIVKLYEEVLEGTCAASAGK